MAGTQVLAPDSNARPLEAVLGRDNVFTCDECVRCVEARAALSVSPKMPVFRQSLTHSSSFKSRSL
jgi:hypothetical protein